MELDSSGSGGSQGPGRRRWWLDQGDEERPSVERWDPDACVVWLVGMRRELV